MSERPRQVVHSLLPPEKKENKLYVGNLDSRVNEFTLLQLFKPFGTIVREEFLWHTQGPSKGEPRGYCFIEYATRQEAERAVKEMDAKVVYGRKLKVSFAEEPKGSFGVGAIHQKSDVPYKNKTLPKDETLQDKTPRDETLREIAKETVSELNTVPSEGSGESLRSIQAKISALKSKLRLLEAESAGVVAPLPGGGYHSVLARAFSSSSQFIPKSTSAGGPVRKHVGTANLRHNPLKPNKSNHFK